MSPDNRFLFAQCPAGHATAVVGLQWGDEGKGKAIDLLAPGYQAVVRYNGGANAGHSVVIAGKRHALHLIPSGVFHPGVAAIIGNGVVVDPEALLKEMDALAASGIDLSGLKVSANAHVVLPYHKLEDALREHLLTGVVGGESIGTTKRGIGPAYSDKASRSGAVRMGDLIRPEVLRRIIERVVPVKNAMLRALDPEAEPIDDGAILAAASAWGVRLAPHLTDSTSLVQDLMDAGGRVLIEGANATLLDLDHGTFPFVTSSNCSALGVCAGSGIAPKRLSRVIGVAKAYCTRVGGGPFPTEQNNADGDRIRERGREYGTTTGRPRRCGWLDLVALRYAVRLNDADGIALTLLDVLSGFGELAVCVAYEINGKRTERFVPDAETLSQARPVYERLPGFDGDISGVRRFADLPDSARGYVEFIERFAGAPINLIGVGPDRTQTIVREN